MNVSFKIKNINAFKRKLKAIHTTRMRGALSKAVEAGAEVIVGAAKERTPVDTGLLRDNVSITPYNMTANEASANIAYMQDYAPYVHERLELQHAVGEAKFLEKAMMSPVVRQKTLSVICRYMKF